MLPELSTRPGRIIMRQILLLTVNEFLISSLFCCCCILAFVTFSSWFCVVCSWVECVAKTRKAMNKSTKLSANGSSPTIAFTRSWYYYSTTNSQFSPEIVTMFWTQLIYANLVTGILYSVQSLASQTRVRLRWNFDNAKKSLDISFLLCRVRIHLLYSSILTPYATKPLINDLSATWYFFDFHTGVRMVFHLYRHRLHQLHILHRQNCGGPLQFLALSSTSTDTLTTIQHMVYEFLFLSFKKLLLWFVVVFALVNFVKFGVFFNRTSTILP